MLIALLSDVLLSNLPIMLRNHLKKPSGATKRQDFCSGSFAIRVEVSDQLNILWGTTLHRESVCASNPAAPGSILGVPEDFSYGNFYRR